MNQTIEQKNTEDFVKSLSQSLKDELTAPSDYHSIDNVSPTVVLSPISNEHISESLRKASEYDLKVCPIGGATRLAIGNKPTQYDVGLTLNKLDKVIDYKPSDLSITVQAGITLEQLQKQLQKNNQFLPVSAPLAQRSTIGGILAIGTSGSLTWLNGTLRDLVTGMKTVHPDGVISKSGGQVMKNVSGYEMSRLHIGGLGTIGVISEVSLKVMPKPENEVSVMTTFASQADAFNASMSIFRSKINKLCLSYINPGALHHLNIKSIKPGHLIAVRLFGKNLSLKRCIDEVDSLLKQHNPKTISQIRGQEQGDVWQKISDFGWNSDTRPYLSMRISLPPNTVGDILGSLESTTITKGLMPGLSTQIGHGTILFHVYDVSKNTDQKKFEEIVSDVRRLVRQRRGTAVVEQGPEFIKEDLGVWDGFEQNEKIFKSLKSNYDPLNILNPGRLF